MDINYEEFKVTIKFKNGYELTRGYVGSDYKRFRDDLMWLAEKIADKVQRKSNGS